MSDDCIGAVNDFSKCVAIRDGACMVVCMDIDRPFNRDTDRLTVTDADGCDVDIDPGDVDGWTISEILKCVAERQDRPASVAVEIMYGHLGADGINAIVSGGV